MNYFKQYLEQLEKKSLTYNYDDMYLWPRTPIGDDHQSVILKRVGATDNDLQNPCSRTAMIINCINKLIDVGYIKKDFYLLDVCCGDALVIKYIKEKFIDSDCFGIDCNKDKFSTHESITKANVLLFNAYLQQIVSDPPQQQFDIALMLNSYRGWESADLKPKYADLPRQIDEWFIKHAKFTIVTATKVQIKRLSKIMHLIILGKGEDNSFMICISKNYKLKPAPSIFNLFSTIKLLFNGKSS